MSKKKKGQRQLTPHVVPSTGETVMIPPVSIVGIGLRLKRQYKEPKPPLTEVTIANEKIVERNYADPEYATARRQWENEIDTEAVTQAAKIVAYKQVLTDEQKAEVAEFREIIEDYETDERIIWLNELAVTTQDELMTIVNIAGGKADPQEDNIDTAANNFQGDTKGA